MTHYCADCGQHTVLDVLSALCASCTERCMARMAEAHRKSCARSPMHGM